MAAKIVVFPSLSTHIPVKFADSTKCTTIDVSKDTATGRVTLVEGKVDEAALPVWLNKVIAFSFTGIFGNYSSLRSRKLEILISPKSCQVSLMA